MPDEVFGSAVTKGEVVAAVRSTIERWAPDYFAWRQRVSGLRVPPPRHYLTLRELDDWPKVSPPSVLVACTGLAEEAKKSGTRSFRAPWAVGLVAVVTGRDRADADAVAEETGVALRSLIVHKGSLGGFADGTDWLDERYDVLPDQNRRQLAAVRLEFSVDVRNVLTGRGPSAPSPTGSQPAPIPDRPRVREDGATVEVRAEDL